MGLHKNYLYTSTFFLLFAVLIFTTFCDSKVSQEYKPLTTIDTIFSRVLKKCPEMKIPIKFNADNCMWNINKFPYILDSAFEYNYISEYRNFTSVEMGISNRILMKYHYNDSICIMVYKIKNTADNYDNIMEMCTYNINSLNIKRPIDRLILFRHKTGVYQNESFVDSNFIIYTKNEFIDTGNIHYNIDTCIYINYNCYKINKMGDFVLIKQFNGKSKSFSNSNKIIKKFYISDSSNILILGGWQPSQNDSSKRIYYPIRKTATLKANGEILLNKKD